MRELDELEADALAEIINLGIGNAALGLSDITGEEVQLSVPSVQLISRARAVELLGQISQPMAGVQQKFTGDFEGHALLLFPEDKSLELVRIMLSESAPLASMTELEEDAFLEVGNMILNACLASFADSLQADLSTELPVGVKGTSVEIHGDGDDEVQLLLMFISFTLQERDITGNVSFMLDMHSIDTLRELVRAFLARVGA